MFTFSSAGESHGPGVMALIDGVPSGFVVTTDDIDRDLVRRQKGYGRGGRMSIERDRVKILSGIRGKVTIGSPVVLLIHNKDWKNWAPYMNPEGDTVSGKEVTRPRPGHADLSGGMKYGHRDLRNVLERASARETAARTAAGSLAKTLLLPFGIEFYGYVVSIGEIRIDADNMPLRQRIENANKSPFGTPTHERDEEIKIRVDEAKERGDTLGGVIEVIASGLPPGLGSPSQWYTRLDAKLAFSVMSIPAIKGVEIGDGFRLSERFGSEAHDEIFFGDEKGFYRKTNRAGGLEGGMTNGSHLVVRASMKPIPTLRSSLSSVDIDTKEAVDASSERSDICAVPSASVVAEAMVALIVAGEFFAKFGGDTKEDIAKSFKSYIERIRNF
jgi:chorismate synthase